MSWPRTAAAAALVCAAYGTPAAGLPQPGGAIEVRFCPPGHVRTYALDSPRRLQSLLLQNLAIISREKAPLTIASISIDLLRVGVVVDERRLAGTELQRLADAGGALQKSGALQLFAFQFCGTDMIPAGSRLSGPVLAPGEVLLVPQQAFAYGGDRDELRVHVQARSEGRYVEVSASLPIFSGFAKHEYRFPLRGTWYIGAGPSFHTAHRWAVMEEFAFDILKVGDSGVTHRPPGTEFDEYFAYGAEVLAAADGQVVAVASDEPEDRTAMRQPAESETAYLARLQQDQAARIEKGVRAVIGNFVAIDHGDGEYSLSLHLKPGSVRVRAGDRVRSGQVIGLLGSSGNSTEPHLHFQVCDRPDPLTCAGIPVNFTGVTLPLADVPRLMQSGDVVVAR